MPLSHRALTCVARAGDRYHYEHSTLRAFEDGAEYMQRAILALLLLEQERIATLLPAGNMFTVLTLKELRSVIEAGAMLFPED